MDGQDKKSLEAAVSADATVYHLIPYSFSDIFFFGQVLNTENGNVAEQRKK